MRRRTALLLSSVIALSCPTAGWAGNGKPVSPLISLGMLPSMRFNVDSIDTEPINGFIPQVVMGLTNEQDSDNEYSGVEGFGIASSSPGGSSLPIGGSPQYVVATLDSGSIADIISYDAAQAFDLQARGWWMTEAGHHHFRRRRQRRRRRSPMRLGVYATDFSHASVNSSGC